MEPIIIIFKDLKILDFPGGPVVKTLRFHCRGHGFDPWSGKIPSRAARCDQKKKQNRKTKI